jgi:CubicO group peptidase (beta-lactamase class C family)
MDNSHALGWDTPSKKSSSGRHFSPHSIGHLGYSGCSLWIDLEAGIAAVLLTNRTWPDRKNQLHRKVRPAFHNAVREALARMDSYYPLKRTVYSRILSSLAHFANRIKNWGQTRC